MTGTQPILTLNNGVQMPAHGLGTFLSPPEETCAAVESAIGCGYRLLDTAAAYQNEQSVGQGIRNSGIARNELFVTTKLWITDYGYDAALKAFDQSMQRLELEYLDLYLLHWPVPSSFEKTIDAYRALEHLLAEKRVRAIGVSNFQAEHLERLAAQTEIVPAVNQIELNPRFNQLAMRQTNAQRGIITQSWSPIGGAWSNAAEGENQEQRIWELPELVAIGQQHGKTAVQVVIRWHLQLGLSVIPKSVNAKRIAENGSVFDFQLSDEEMATINGLDTGLRSGPDPDVLDIAFLEARRKK